MSSTPRFDKMDGLLISIPIFTVLLGSFISEPSKQATIYGHSASAVLFVTTFFFIILSTAVICIREMKKFSFIQ